MMSIFNVTIIAADQKAEQELLQDLRKTSQVIEGVRFSCATDQAELGQILFIDSGHPDLGGTLASVDRKGRAVFLMVREGTDFPAEILSEGQVDDILVRPFRALEVLSKLRHYQQILMWDEVNSLNASFSELLERLHDDLRLAERLQKSKVPVRFAETKGMQVSSRYLAGMKSGGDHFDLADSRDGNQLSMFLSDSSSYGLSSAVLSILMKVAMKLSVEEARSCKETVRRIHEELILTLSEKDKLSLFYGTVSRKDYRLRYMNLGTSCAFYAPPKGEFTELPSQGGFLTQKGGLSDQPESEIVLLPESRLALISDGFVEVAGGTEEMKRLLDRFRSGDPKDSLNEMVYRVKQKFTEPDDMPAQDCTAVLFDVDARVMRMV